MAYDRSVPSIPTGRDRSRRPHRRHPGPAVTTRGAAPVPASLIGVLCLLSSCFAGAAGFAGPEAAEEARWENVTTKLWPRIPGYAHDPQWYNRRIGTVHVDNTNGDLYAMLCAGWGTWRSGDTGETWEQADATALGRQVGNRGVCANPITGDFVLFKVDGGPPAQGAIVLEHGRRWLPLPEGIGDGFRSGLADWSEDPPTTFLAVRHHHDGLYLTENGGTTWAELPRRGGYGAAMLDAETILLAFPREADRLEAEGRKDGAWWLKSRPREIRLTTDRGATFTKVGEFTPRAETPARHGDDLFWIAAEGVMVSRDRGRSWQGIGPPAADLLYGPYFGADAGTLVVVSRSGFHRTTGGGATWTKLAGMMVPEGSKIEHAHPAWDPVRNVLYLGFLGDDIYRFRLPTR